jgi:hypothetical protein
LFITDPLLISFGWSAAGFGGDGCGVGVDGTDGSGLDFGCLTMSPVVSVSLLNVFDDSMVFISLNLVSLFVVFFVAKFSSST